MLTRSKRKRQASTGGGGAGRASDDGWVCPRCDHVTPWGTDACAGCGTEPDPWRCAKCHHPNSIGEMACGDCGITAWGCGSCKSPNPAWETNCGDCGRLVSWSGHKRARTDPAAALLAIRAKRKEAAEKQSALVEPAEQRSPQEQEPTETKIQHAPPDPDAAQRKEDAKRALPQLDEPCPRCSAPQQTRLLFWCEDCQRGGWVAACCWERGRLPKKLSFCKGCGKERRPYDFKEDDDEQVPPPKELDEPKPATPPEPAEPKPEPKPQASPPASPAPASETEDEAEEEEEEENRLLDAVRRLRSELSKKDRELGAARLVMWGVWHEAGLCDLDDELPCEECEDECEWCFDEVHQRCLTEIETGGGRQSSRFCRKCLDAIRAKLNALGS